MMVWGANKVESHDWSCGEYWEPVIYAHMDSYTGCTYVSRETPLADCEALIKGYLAISAVDAG